MEVHLVDGTYELFRFHYAPNNRDPQRGAVVGVLGSMLDLLEDGATHLGVATDQVIESFRNQLYPGYKDGSGIEPDLAAQFPVLEATLAAAGLVVWPMVEFEADDALGAAARMAAADPRVERVWICTPDKDLAQCVDDAAGIVQFDRRKRSAIDEAGVRDKFGVAPASIPDFLALVGDSADGFPGLPGWGAKSTAAVLAHYGHIENIPEAPGQWEVTVRGSAKLAATLVEHKEQALLFRRIATIAVEAPVSATVDELAWAGPGDELAARCEELGAAGLARRAAALWAHRQG